jgi:hypothetical protein
MMQNRQETHQPALRQDIAPATGRSQPPRLPTHRDSEQEDEDLTSDDEPHGEVASQAITRRRRQKRLDNIPPHHMGHYSPSSQTVLRAAKMFVTQLILTHDAYPRDTVRREMGKQAWEYALKVEADAFAEGKISCHYLVPSIKFLFQLLPRNSTIPFIVWYVTDQT